RSNRDRIGHRLRRACARSLGDGRARWPVADLPRRPAARGRGHHGGRSGDRHAGSEYAPMIDPFSLRESSSVRAGSRLRLHNQRPYNTISRGLNWKGGAYLMAKVYCRIASVILLVLVPLGLVNAGMPGVFTFYEPGEIGLHLVLGLLAVVAGFTGGPSGRWAILYGKVFGVVLVVLAAVGFVVPDLIPRVIHLDVGDNFLHLALGIWGLWVGYFGAQPVETVESHAHLARA